MLLLLFSARYFFNNLFDTECNGNAKRKIRCKRTCPKCQIRRCNHRTQFDAEYDVQQIAAPYRRIHNNHNNQQQHKRVPVLALIPDPFAEIDCFGFQLSEKFYNCIFTFGFFHNKFPAVIRKRTSIGIAVWILLLPAPAVLAHLFNVALGFPAQFFIRFARV